MESSIWLRSVHVTVFAAILSMATATLAADTVGRIRMPGPAVQDRMLGTWAIRVTHAPSKDSASESVTRGREVWRLGPGGRSLIEEYDEDAPTGHIHEFGIAWWDPAAAGQQVLWCGDYRLSGCVLVPQVARWEGNSLVHTVESDEAGEHVVHQEIFTDISARSFTQILKEGPSRADLRVTATIRATKLAPKGRNERK